MITVTVNTLAAPNVPQKEFEYKLEGPKTVGEVVGAAKILHPNWSSMVVVITRPKSEGQTGPA